MLLGGGVGLQATAAFCLGHGRHCHCHCLLQLTSLPLHLIDLTGIGSLQYSFFVFVHHIILGSRSPPHPQPSPQPTKKAVPFHPASSFPANDKFLAAGKLYPLPFPFRRWPSQSVCVFFISCLSANVRILVLTIISGHF